MSLIAGTGIPVSKVPLWRGLAEQWLGSFVVARRLPVSSGGGRLYASARAGGLRYLFMPSRALDPDLLRIASLLVQPGDCVWDVGCNVGLFAVAAAHHAGQGGAVYGFEADTDAVCLLHRTAAGLGGRLTVVPVAVSDSDGFVRFAIAKRSRSSNAIEGYGSTQMGGVDEVRVHPCRRLDGMLDEFPAPHVLKIDVEGAELLALDGAKRILAEFRPKVHIEYTDDTLPELVRILTANGYYIGDDISYAGGLPQHFAAASTCNLVAIHPQQRSGS